MTFLLFFFFPKRKQMFIDKITTNLQQWFFSMCRGRQKMKKKIKKVMSFIPIQKRMENNCHKCTSSKRSFLWNFSYRIKKHFFIDKITNNLQQLSFSIARETWTNLLWITRCFHKSSIKVRQLNGIDTTVGEEIIVQKRNIKESIM